MAQHHKKIYPDVEIAMPTRPRASLGLENGDPSPIRWCHQASPSLSLIPSPSQTPIQTLNLNPRRCCCKCLCWTVGLLTLLLFIVGATAGIIYLVFQPKPLNFDMTLSARFNVRITTDNPNKKIGIYYEKGSRLSVWYKDTNLCQGTIPKFYQGRQNKTVLNVALTGRNRYGTTLLNALQEQQQTGRVPLDLNKNVPVSVKLGALKLRKVRILGTCMLIADSLTTNSLISIKASSCHFGLKL
ncbi:hypothetical protein SASPL_136488 [Salvia splendens]|uniref:Late embryogenesis abundant protein LEA-2 subgroup domain-containing protein n=1 Tax=Salvia splendens TaxID=180675 RepID=A0A8X8X1E7_SALSN|nr:NDR1/HIN1-like protein 6 [Salvia splendens]KAG6404244.1 hypothetical protein SASPL_136488 [Salvia splendens]